MRKISEKTYWLAVNQQRRDGLIDAFSNSKLFIPRGNWVRLNIALFDGDPRRAENLVTDLSNIASATLTFRKVSATGQLLKEWVVPAEQFDNPALTFEEWEARESQHLSFRLTAEETNWSLDGWKNGELYFVVATDTFDAGPVTFQGGKGEVYEDGTGEAGEPTEPVEPVLLTEDVADARYWKRSELEFPPPSNVFSGGWYP